ncbi:MAG TPA: hypothetical protein DCO77_08925 [Nitrospiraceae bacterium]|nr:hypothetical protein [Nitrospiraceae bacterium]
MNVEELAKIVNFLLPVLAIFFIFSFYVFSVNLWHAHASRSWPAVDGVIRSADLEQVEVATMYYAGTSYSVKVHFDFTVQGAMHTSDNMSITDTLKSFGEEMHANIYLEQFPVGKPVKVYYDPDNPFFAVLNPGFSDEFVRYKKTALWRLAFLAVGILLALAFKSFSAGL